MKATIKIKKSNLLKNVSTVSKLYIILFIAIMFCGNTFIIRYAPYFMIAEIILLFCMCAFRGLRREGFVNNTNIVLILLLIMFVLYMAIQLTFAYAPNITLIYMLRYFLYIWFIILIADTEVQYCTIKCIRIYALIAALSVIMDVFTKKGLPGGLLGNYQAAGMMMSVACIVFLIDYAYDNNNITNIIGLIMALIALLATGKRMFCLLAGAAFFVIYVMMEKNKEKENKKRRMKYIVIGGVMLLAVVIAIIYIPAASEVFNRFMELSTGDESVRTSGRSDLWDIAMKIYREHKLTGIGFANFKEYYEAKYFTKEVGAYLTHNIYVGLLAETGIIGFLIMVMFMAAALVSSIKVFWKVRNTKETKHIYVMMYSVLIQVWFVGYGYSGNGIYDINEFFFYLMAVAMSIAVSRDIKKKKIAV